MGKGGSAKKKAGGPPSSERHVCTNPKATQRFDIEERYEAGIELAGSEVKSLRDRRASLDGAYASLHGDDVYLHKMHIAPYAQATFFGHEPKRSRKLLLHRREIERIRGKLSMRGYTLIPVRIYFKRGWAKVELGLGKGKRLTDRREELKRKQAASEARAAMQRAGKGMGRGKGK